VDQSKTKAALRSNRDRCLNGVFGILRDGPISVALLFFFILISPIGAQQNDCPKPTGLYLGQKPPETTPEVFAPGIVSTDTTFETGITFAPDGKEVFFTRRVPGTSENRIHHIRFENGIWTRPRLSPFSDGNRESEPNFSPDGLRIFFNSRRPLPDDVTTGHEMNVWQVRRVNGSWTESEVLGPPVSNYRPMFVTETKDGTIYFTGNIDRGIYRAKSVSGTFLEPERLPDCINGLNWAGHPYIDPEGRYLIFDSNVDQKGTKSLFISFRSAQDEWSPAFNVNEYLRVPNHAAIPHVSPDGKYLFFSSRGDIYWVIASFLEDLEPKEGLTD
jgi:hypothetical protein